MSELLNLGGQKSDLPHDTKIYITAKGIKKTLAEAIESGEIADGNRFGADVKNFAYAISDGSGEEHNTEVPFLNTSGNTQLDITFEIKDHEVASLYIGGVYYTKYISDTVSPDKWWRIVNDNAIEIQGDLTGSPESINFIIFRGSEIPVVPSVFSGLKIEHSAYGFTDSSIGDNITSIDVISGKTVIQFSFDVLAHDVPFVYIDGELYPEYSAANNTGRWHKKLSSNTIQLGDDLSGDHLSIYTAVFQGKSFIDQYGNMVVTLKPEIASFILEAPNGDKYQIACSLNGELEAETIVTNDPSDLILFRRDDGVILELKISDEGAFSAEEQTTAGILFERIYLSDIDGLIWKLGAINDNTLYTEANTKNYFQLLRPSGNVLKQISAMSKNAVYEVTGYVEEEDLDTVIDEPNQTITTTVVRKKDGGFSLFRWDTLMQRWDDFLLTASSPFGIAVDYFGTKESIPDTFAIANGKMFLKSKYPRLFSKIGILYGESEDKSMFALPQLSGVVIRGVDEAGNIDIKQAENRVRLENAPEGEMVGSFQPDAMQGHKHFATDDVGDFVNIYTGAHKTYELVGGTNVSRTNPVTGNPASDGINGTPRTDHESRMVNVNAYKIMRLK